MELGAVQIAKGVILSKSVRDTHTHFLSRAAMRTSEITAPVRQNAQNIVKMVVIL